MKTMKMYRLKNISILLYWLVYAKTQNKTFYRVFCFSHLQVKFLTLLTVESSRCCRISCCDLRYTLYIRVCVKKRAFESRVEKQTGERQKL